MKKLTIIFSLSFLASCGSKVIVDTKGVNQKKYKIDYDQCEKISEQVNSADKALKQGLFAALVYGAIGAVAGDDGGKLAKIGAISGTAAGLSEASLSKENVMKNCLKNRGYVVLN